MMDSNDQTAALPFSHSYPGHRHTQAIPLSGNKSTLIAIIYISEAQYMRF